MKARRRTRRGMAVVETALVLGVFLMLLFGIFEYCRFLLVLHVANNAARDGARYAAVNVNCPSDQITARQAQIIQYTKDRMGGVQNQIQGCQVAVYPCDSTGLSQTPPVVRSKSKSGAAPYPDPFSPGANSPDWNSAVFTERIAVTVTGTYKPILPTLLFMPSSIPISVTALTESEG